MNSIQNAKLYSPMLASSQVKSRPLGQHQSHQLHALSQDIMLQLPTQPIQPNMLNRSGSQLMAVTTSDRNSYELMPDIQNILSKNKAVMPTLASTSSTNVTTMASHQQQQHHHHQQQQHQQQQQQQPQPRPKKVTKGKRQQSHNWARTLTQADQPLILDSRLSDPVTRNQFNSEFAKKITSHGIGAEMFGMSQDRLPSLRGTYRLDIKERIAENGGGSGSGGGVNGEAGATSNGETLYTYDIVDIGGGIASDICKVICGLCNFSNARIENVLFHCEIDHKQYFCQNKRCQNGFSSWDSLMRHMKNVHRKEKQ